jgi:hypothetical protein
MGYAIHIRRVTDDGETFGKPIALTEWKAAVETVKEVRLASGDYVIINPSTGEEIRFPNSGGDAEVFFPAESKWIRVYRWHNGDISFRGLPSFNDPDDPVRMATFLLAISLNARIVGDDGEIYDYMSGPPRSG